MYSYGFPHGSEMNQNRSPVETMNVSPDKTGQRPLASSENIPDEMLNESLKTNMKRLTREAEKIRSWMTKTEIEMEEKENIIKEASQTIDQLRKAVIDAQSQNDANSIHFHDELAKKEEILQKIEATREVCDILKQNIKGYEEAVEEYSFDKKKVEQEEQRRMDLHNDLSQKFSQLSVEIESKKSYFHEALATEQADREKWLNDQELQLNVAKETAQKALIDTTRDSASIAHSARKIDQAACILVELKQVTDDMQQGYFKLAEDHAKTGQEILTLEKHNEEILENVTNAGEQVTKMKKHFQDVMTELETTANVYRERQTALLANQNKMEEKIEIFKNNFQVIQQKVIESDAKIQEYINDIQKLENENISIFEECKRMKEEVENKFIESDGKISEMKGQLQSSFNRENDYLNQLDVTKQQQHMVRQAKESLEKELEEKNKELKTADADSNRELQTLKRQLSYTVKQFEGVVADLQSEVTSLQTEVEALKDNEKFLNDQKNVELSEHIQNLQTAQSNVQELEEKVQQRDLELSQRTENGKKDIAQVQEMKEIMMNKEAEFEDKLKAEKKALEDKFKVEKQEFNDKLKNQEKELKDKLKTVEKELKDKIRVNEREFKEKTKATDKEQREKLRTLEKENKDKLKIKEQEYKEKLKENSDKMKQNLEREMSKRVMSVSSDAKSDATSCQNLFRSPKSVTSTRKASPAEAEPEDMEVEEMTEKNKLIQSQPVSPSISLWSVGCPSVTKENIVIESNQQTVHDGVATSSPATSIWSVGIRSPKKVAKPTPPFTPSYKIPVPNISQDVEMEQDDVSVASSSSDLLRITMEDVINKRLPISTPKMSTPNLSTRPPTPTQRTPSAQIIGFGTPNIRRCQPIGKTPSTPIQRKTIPLNLRTPIQSAQNKTLTPCSKNVPVARNLVENSAPLPLARTLFRPSTPSIPTHRSEYSQPKRPVFYTPQLYTSRPNLPRPSPSSSSNSSPPCIDPGKLLKTIGASPKINNKFRAAPDKRQQIATGKLIGAGDAGKLTNNRPANTGANVRSTKKKGKAKRAITKNKPPVAPTSKDDVLGWFDDDF